MGTSHDIAEIEVQDSGHWELAAAAARLERALLARRLHNGPMQDIAATILELQVLAGRADASSQAGLEDAVAVLIEQQRSIRSDRDRRAGRRSAHRAGLLGGQDGTFLQDVAETPEGLPSKHCQVW